MAIKQKKIDMKEGFQITRPSFNSLKYEKTMGELWKHIHFIHSHSFVETHWIIVAFIFGIDSMKETGAIQIYHKRTSF